MEPSMFAPTSHFWRISESFTNLLAKTQDFYSETLPKAIRTQALTALTSSFGLVGKAWLDKLRWLCFVWSGIFALADLVW